MKTSNFDKWLMAGPSDTNAEDEYIENRVFELMLETGEYNPSDVFRMGEALQQCSSDEQIQATISDYVEQKDWAKLGLKLYQIAFDYQEEYATSQAISEMNQGLHL